MTGKLLVNCTYGEEDPERATLPFVVGNAAVTADQEAVVFLTVEGVRLATKGYADGVHKEGFQPLGELIRSFIGNGGQVREATWDHRRRSHRGRAHRHRRQPR
jgi:predicted peroxiredoxin